MTHAQQFVAEIDAFLTRSGMSASAFGRSAVNDPNFVGDLRAGRMPNLGLVERVHNFIRSQESSPPQAPNDEHDGAPADAVEAAQ